MSELITNDETVLELADLMQKVVEASDSPPQMVARVKQAMRQAGPVSVAKAEAQLRDRGFTIPDLLVSCDIHLASASEDPTLDELEPSHPVSIFRAENAAIMSVIERLRAYINCPTGACSPENPPESSVSDICFSSTREALNELMAIDTHYARKENLLFSHLERYGIDGPSTVMWAKDDEIRGMLKEWEEQIRDPKLNRGKWATIREELAEPTLAEVEQMVQREEKILFPMTLKTFDDADWQLVDESSSNFGWCLIDPKGTFKPREEDETAVSLPIAGNNNETEKQSSMDGRITFPTGSLSLSELQAIFATMPFDTTFIDSDDRVRFFSEGDARIFVRPKSVIGRKVQHCHPPKSVHLVEQILEDFKSGAQDVAEFWLEIKERFLHIRYFAVRDDQKLYLGTLEVSQDITNIRKLEGERKLLVYDN